MARNDVEMEDAHKPDPGNDIKDSKDEVLDSEIEVKEKEPLSAVTVVRNDDSKNGGDNSSKLSNEEKDQVTSMGELENKTHHENYTNEPMAGDLAEPTGELVNAENKNGKEISTEADAEVQTDADINEPMAGVPVEPTGELVNAENKNGKEISTEANAELQTDAESKVQKLNDVMTKMVENSEADDGLKEEDPVENGVESENPVENVEGHSSGDVALEKTKDSEEDKICATNFAKNTDSGGDSWENKKLETRLSSNEGPQAQSITLDEVIHSGDKGMEAVVDANEDKIVNDGSKKQVMEIIFATPVTNGNAMSETLTKLKVNDSSLSNQHEAATSISPVRCFPSHMGNHGEQADKTFYSHATLPLVGESDDGTPEEQAAFMRQLESFYREKAMDFKPPKFYGQPLNCLKLWRAVIKLGGYDRVTGSKLWRQVGESFHPPKTCTTVSWTFRIFYEKSLLEFERHKRISGDLQLPMAMLPLPEPSGGTADSEGNSYQGSGSGRARRDAAARAMQGWLVQRHSDLGETGEPVTKDKNINNMVKREKNIKSIASLKQKRPNEVEHPVKAARTETSKQLVTSIVDIGPPADWVKINVLQMKECFEIYVLIPGLLRDEVRVQSDPDGRLVITGQPTQADNPWGITPFKKVVKLPARIDPLHASAVVSFHGRLLVRVPFESNS